MNARGSIYLAARRWFEDKLDAGALHRLMDICGYETVNALLCAQRNNWYPLEYLEETFDLLKNSKLFETLKEKDFGCYLCETTFERNFRGLVSFVGPVTFARRISLFWERYFDEGNFSVKELNEDSVELCLEETKSSVFLENLMTGWLTKAFRMICTGESYVEQVAPCHWRVRWGSKK